MALNCDNTGCFSDTVSRVPCEGCEEFYDTLCSVATAEVVLAKETEVRKFGDDHFCRRFRVFRFLTAREGVIERLPH